VRAERERAGRGQGSPLPPIPNLIPPMGGTIIALAGKFFALKYSAQIYFYVQKFKKKFTKNILKIIPHT